jgi:hypothetical protein
MAKDWVDAATFDRELKTAVANTDNEIFRAATGQEEYPDAIPEDFYSVEGADGEPLPDHEIAHRNLYGDTLTDRPIAMAEEIDLVRTNQELAAELQRVTEAYRQHVEEPQREAQRQQLREYARKGMEQYGLYDLAGDPAKTDALVAQFLANDQQLAALQTRRVNESLERAREKYGEDFESTWQDIEAMDPTNPLAQQIAKSIVNADDPGEQLLLHHDSALVHSLGPSGPPPFMAGRNPPRLQRQIGARSKPGFEAGWGERDTEQDIFSAVFDDGNI